MDESWARQTAGTTAYMDTKDFIVLEYIQWIELMCDLIIWRISYLELRGCQK